jgi:hypothetical protein
LSFSVRDFQQHVGVAWLSNPIPTREIAPRQVVFDIGERRGRAEFSVEFGSRE